MKLLIALAFSFILAAHSTAQNLSNPDFETSWTSGPPPGWSILTPALTASRDTSVFTCGTASCRLRTGNLTTGDFGKQWLTSSTPAIKTGDVIMGKFRVRLPTGQPFGSGTAYIQAMGADSVTGTIAGTTMSTPVSPSNSWQEISVYYVVPSIPVNGLTISIGVHFKTMPPGILLWLDQVFFQGTSTSFGSLLAPLCAEPDFVISSVGLQYSLDAYSGNVKKVLDMTSGLSYMPSVPSVLPLFTLETIWSENNTAPWITNTSYGYCVIRPPIGGQPWVVESANNTSGIPEASNIKVRVTITPSTTVSDIAFGLTVVDSNTSTSGNYYDEFQCPIVKMSPQLGASDSDDTVFLPGGDGWTDTGNDIFSLGIYPHTRNYPGYASMQFEAFFDSTMGLSVEAHDPDGEYKVFGWRAEHTPENNVELMVLRQYPMANNRTVQSYPVVVSKVSGVWENAAKHYRTWARTQSWATSPKYRGTASWVHTRPPIYNADLEVMGNTVYLVDPAGTPSWLDVMNDWATALGPGTNMTTLFRNFEHYGIYAGPYYATANADLKPSGLTDSNCWNGLLGSGHHTMAMVAGLKWLRSRNIYPPGYPCTGCPEMYWIQGFYGGMPGLPNCDSSPTGPPNACTLTCGTGQVLDATGLPIDAWSAPFVNSSGPANPPGVSVCVVGVNGCTESFPAAGSWDGVHSWMCPRCRQTTSPSSPYMASMLLGNCAALLASKGMQLFELDQMQGGGNPACYSTDPLHDGHPKGFGKWIYNGIVSTMQAVRDVRQGGAYPDFAMSMEDPGELYIPYLDCMLGRPNNVNAWPADSMANSLVVPAFEYVYSDLVPIQTADLSIGASFATGGDDPFNQEKSIVDLSRLYVAGGWLEFEIPPWLEYWRWAPPNNYAPLSSHTNSKHLAYIRNCTVSLANVALPFFDTGRMVSADGFSPPPYTYNEAVWDGSTNTCGGLSGFTCVPHTVSAVNHSAWKIGSTGPSALVLTNADMLHSSVLITLPTSYDGISYPPSTPCTVWRNGTSGGASTFGANATITLNQLDIVVVTF